MIEKSPDDVVRTYIKVNFPLIWICLKIPDENVLTEIYNINFFNKLSLTLILTFHGIKIWCHCRHKLVRKMCIIKRQNY